MHRIVCVLGILVCAATALAEPPGLSYLFPAGAQRGTHATVRVGGFYFHGQADVEVDGNGVSASPKLKETETIWFEGPLLVEPDSQKKEDYPKDYLGDVQIDAVAPLGIRHISCRTSQGATAALKFVVGDLPEVTEEEIDGTPLPHEVTLPVTINGRIFPRQNVDEWRFHVGAGEVITCQVASRVLGYPLQAVLDISGPDGRPVRAHRELTSEGDPVVWFKAEQGGEYQVAIHDAGYSGGQNYVYRLSVTQGPRITSYFPLGGQQGQTVNLTVAGPGLPSQIVPISLPNVVGDFLTKEVSIGGKPAGLVTLQVDDVPELTGTPEKAGVISEMPAICNGCIVKPGQMDAWTVRLEKGQSVLLETLAAQLGSRLDSMLSVVDADGKELAKNDDAGDGRSDSRLVLSATKSGTYTVRVSDRFASRGGAEFGYRLRVTPVGAADFVLKLAADAVNIIRQSEVAPEEGANKKLATKVPGLRVEVAPLGAFAKDITLEFDGLPEGVTPDTTVLRAKQKFVEVHFNAPAQTPLQLAHVKVRGSAEIDGKHMVHAANVPTGPGEPLVESVRLAIVPPVPFRMVGQYHVTNDQPGGTILEKHFDIERGGFDGPLQVRLADRQVRYLRGVSGPVLTIPAGATTFEYPVHFPAVIEQGHTSRVQLMLIGEMVDHDGTHHTISYTSADNDDQVIAITAAGRLQISSPQTSYGVSPGGRLVIPVSVQRDGSLAGCAVEVTLQVPRHIKGVHAKPLRLEPGQGGASLEVTLDEAPGPFNAPVTVAARTLGNGAPQLAETRVELVMEKP